MTTPEPPPLPAAAAPAKRGRWFWVLQVVPPLLLVLTMLTDGGPGLYFGLLALVLFFVLPSLLSIVLRIGFLLFGRGDWRRLLRPLLTIGIVVAALAYVQWSLVEVREVVHAEAERIQAECVRLGKCPEALSIGRGTDGDRRQVPTPSTHLWWPITYRASEEGFEVYLHEMIDTSLRWSGGPHAELERESLIDGHSLDLDD